VIVAAAIRRFSLIGAEERHVHARSQQVELARVVHAVALCGGGRHAGADEQQQQQQPSFPWQRRASLIAVIGHGDDAGESE
jgi:hypothetical protein